MKTQSNFNFWWRWLVAVSAGVMLFGIDMVLMPNLIQRFFSLLLYGSPAAIASFDAEAVRYITLAHGLMGAVMFGWGAALMFTLFNQFRAGEHSGWMTLAVSIALWYLVDTSFSLWTGFWQNAMFNTVFVILFAIPLMATYPTFKGS